MTIMETMFRRALRGSTPVYVGAFALALAVAPVTLDSNTLLLKANSALAHGGGGGGGGGGGSGGGDGGHGASDGGKGNSEGHAANADHDGKGSDHKGKDSDHKGRGATASALGSLNASHVSAQGLAHAASNSRVGQLSGYAAAVHSLNAAPPHSLAASRAISQAAQALAKASNKTVTPTVVQAVNVNLGLTVSRSNAAAIARQANFDKGSL
jgi:hypothetical protein